MKPTATIMLPPMGLPGNSKPFFFLAFLTLFFQVVEERVELGVAGSTWRIDDGLEDRAGAGERGPVSTEACPWCAAVAGIVHQERFEFGEVFLWEEI